MICPQCKTQNRDERTECYHCGQELATLRMIVNRARNHYNEALEHAERDRDEEAIRELKHALELDGSFVEAWLVLGTLYARAERLEEAKEAWETAMAQDPRFERGHNYLMKAQKIEPSLPLLRKLKQTVVALGALLILAVAFAVWQSLPDTGMQKINDALTAHEEQRWAAAIEKLADAQSDVMASGKARRTAEVLGEELRARLTGMLEQVRLSLGARQYGQAVASIADIEALQPPGWVQQELGAIKTQLTDSMVEAARRELDAFRDGDRTFGQLEERLTAWIELADSAQSREQLNGLLDEATTEYRRTVLARLRPEILAIEDDAKAAQRIDELAVQYPALSEQLEGLLRSRLAVVAEARSNEFDRLVGQGRLDEAGERLAEFRALYERLGRTAPEDMTRRMEASLRQNERAVALQELESAFEAENYGRVLELAPEVATMELSEARRAEVEARRSDAERLLAEELWDWSQARDQDFETLNISLQEARRMIERYPLILKHAPEAEMTFRTTHTLFRAGAAYLRLGQPEKAREMIERLKRDHPGSAVLDYAAFGRFEDRLAAALQSP